MSNPSTPAQVVEALMQGISEGAWASLHTLFSDEAIIDYPFALPARRQLNGLEDIKKYFAATSAYPMKLQMRNLLVHETANPEVVIVEWDYDGLVESSGHRFRVANITVTTVRNGKIIASRDYHNHAILAAALGRLPSLVAALSDGAKV
jgi:ketosteroid isomerase-like protein